MSTKRIVVLGGGTGGTMVANRLRRHFDADEAEIHVVDRDDAHVYQPGLLFVPFGLADADEIVRPRHRQFRDGIAFHENEVAEVWTRAERGSARRPNGSSLRRSRRRQRRAAPARGNRGARRSRLERACLHLLHARTARLPCTRRWSVSTRGRLVVNLVDMPIKCPVAPLEFAFLADWYLRERGIRNRVELVYSTPLDGAFTKPVASRELAGLLSEKEIELVTEFNAGEVDGVGGKLVSYDGRELDFDLLVTVPLHGGAAYVERSPGLGDALGFVPTDKHTLQTPVEAERLRARRRDRPADLEGRIRHALRGRGAGARTSFATSPARSSWPGTTGTPTASSRPASTRRC